LGTPVLDTSEFRRQLEQELSSNILPFWINHVADEIHGGFHGAVTNDLQILDDVPRSAVLCARILWTFATAYRRRGGAEYLRLARRAYDYLCEAFWDVDYGGVYWQVDCDGVPVSDRKHFYAQAFAIYGLAAYYQATREPRSLARAQTLFELVEEHAFDPVHLGYIEACDRRWATLDDMRLSDRDLNCRKSMNTMLHILEAYSGLLRVWDEPRLSGKHRALLEVFLTEILDSQTGHLRLFFDDAWNSLTPNTSYGHDIEASWLIQEAAGMQADPELLSRSRTAGIRLATVVLREGLDKDGSLFLDGGPQGPSDSGKSWWAQAEAVVGFYAAYQATGEARFVHAALDCWAAIRAKFVDRKNGDWYKRLDHKGDPDPTVYKAGPWECPYHHSRACFEMLDRLCA